jgi:hypothetical protein
MLRIFPLALAMLFALAGCVSPPPSGPFVEYRDGLAPTTRTVKCEANYVLVAKDASAAPGPFGEHHFRKGDEIGFRLESDGSLAAVAPGYTLPLPPGAYAWEVVRDSVPSSRERLWCETKRHLWTAAKITGITFLVCCTTLLVLIIAL